MALVEKLKINMMKYPRYERPMAGDIVELNRGEHKVYAALFGSKKGIVVNPLVTDNGTANSCKQARPMPLEKITTDMKVVGHVPKGLYTHGDVSDKEHRALVKAYFAAQEKKGE